jgi:signal transduction histidine kinase
MIETLLQGWREARMHSKLWLVLSLTVVFPLVFLISVYQVEKAGRANLTTSQLNQISNLQDVLQVSWLENFPLDEFVADLANKQAGLAKVKIIEEVNHELVTRFDLYPTEADPILKDLSPYRTALIKPGETFVYEYVVGEQHVKQAFRAITRGETTFYIFTEHDFTSEHNVFQNRMYAAYFTLAIFFIFIIALAYWTQTQIQYQVLYENLKKTLHDRDLFTSSLVHELRAPMTVIRGYASMIEESSTSTKTEQDFAQKIKLSSERLISLINDFLEAARIKSGQLPVQTTLVDFSLLMQKIVADSQVIARAKGLLLTINIPVVEKMITTDSKRVEQVVTNLLNNAIKYTSEGSITVTVEYQYKKTLVTIADTGDGISAEDQKKLFAPFTRVGDQSRLQTVTGTGLGMWITKLLAEQLGGSVAIESIKGVGTHMILSLPHKEQ